MGLLRPVGKGLYDAIGNVFEWCSDAYESGYIIRGGGYFSIPETLRSARIIAKTSDFARPPLGIRVVMD